MSGLNLQVVFETVVVALMAQGKCSGMKDPESGIMLCRYRGDNDTKCAVGHLIKDEFYSDYLENRRADDPNIKDSIQKSLDVEGLTKHEVAFLVDLQGIHDDQISIHLDQKGDTIGLRMYWEKEFRRFAEKNALSVYFMYELVY